MAILTRGVLAREVTCVAWRGSAHALTSCWPRERRALSTESVSARAILARNYATHWSIAAGYATRAVRLLDVSRPRCGRNVVRCECSARRMLGMFAFVTELNVSASVRLASLAKCSITFGRVCSKTLCTVFDQRKCAHTRANERTARTVRWRARRENVRNGNETRLF